MDESASEKKPREFWIGAAPPSSGRSDVNFMAFLFTSSIMIQGFGIYFIYTGVIR